MNRTLPILLSCLVVAPVHAGTLTWTFDETTTGNDIAWTSPAAVDPAAPRYQIDTEITLVEVTVSWLIFELTLDVTGDVPPEALMNSSTVDGPPPILFFDDQFTYPAPPARPSLSADLRMEIDADGFGQLGVTNVVLGTAEVDLGPPFGVQTVQIEALRIAGQLDVTPLGPAGDVTQDGTVNFDDVLAVLSAWGACPAPPEPCLADTNGDGAVNFTDLLQVLSDWGF